MPEERAVIIDPILAQLSRMDEKLDAHRSETQREIQAVRESVAELKGGFGQMDKRVENLEKSISQIQWSLVSGFLVTILAVLLTKLL